MKSTDNPHVPLHRLLVVAAMSLFAISACGSSDTDAATPISEGSDGSDEPPIGVDDSGNIDFSSDVDAALDSVGFDAIVDIAAGQLDPEPDVEVNGDVATLTFKEGSLESDSWLPCSVLNSLVSGDQTVTVVYPDGEKLC